MFIVAKLGVLNPSIWLTFHLGILHYCKKYKIA